VLEELDDMEKRGVVQKVEERMLMSRRLRSIIPTMDAQLQISCLFLLALFCLYSEVGNLMFYKTSTFALEATLLGQISVLRTSNFREATISR